MTHNEARGIMRLCTHRRLPSMINAMCLGIGPPCAIVIATFRKVLHALYHEEVRGGGGGGGGERDERVQNCINIGATLE